MILFYVDKIVMFVELFAFLEAARSYMRALHTNKNLLALHTAYCLRTVALSFATPGSVVGLIVSTGARRAPAPPGGDVGEIEVVLHGPACARKPKQ